MRHLRVEGRRNDPTWQPKGLIVGRGRLGGMIEQSCKVCGHALHRLVAIDEGPPVAHGPLEPVLLFITIGATRSPVE